MAGTPGKSVELVVPATRIVPSDPTRMLVTESLDEPPRKVEKTRRPAPSSFETNASSGPLRVVCNTPDVTGNPGLLALPATNTLSSESIARALMMGP